jgi:signal transduction histidine kinase
LESQLSEIRRLQRYTDQLLTTMNDGLLAVDRARRISTMNPAARSMLALHETLSVGEPVGDVLKDSPELSGYVDEMFEDDRAWGQREIVLTRSEEPQFILAGSSVLTDSEGNVLELIVNLHDITELKRLEAHMRQADRLAALGVLAAGMAHEIRNPLSAIKTFVQLLPRKVNMPGFLEKFNRTVPRELERINGLIGDLLELARKPKYYFESVQLEPLVRATLELFEEELLLRGVHLTTLFAPHLPPIKGDPSELTKAFQNIVRNAIQAMPSGGILRVGSFLSTQILSNGPKSDDRTWVALEFKDNGIGMGPETLQNVFNPFFTTRDHGTGLGLAITHKIVTELGGIIEVSSRQGEGTSFILCFPPFKS